MNKLSPRDAGFTPIGEVIGNALASYRKGNTEELLRIRDVWVDAVGEAIARDAIPAKFYKNCLTVHVSDSVLLHHLHLLKQDVINKLNQALGLEPDQKSGQEPGQETGMTAISKITFKIEALY